MCRRRRRRRRGCVVIGVVGLVDYQSQMPTKSLSMEYHFKPSCAVVRRYRSMSCSHLFASLPCLRYPFCMVHVAGLNFEKSFVQRSSWCLAIVVDGFMYILRFLRIHLLTASRRHSALATLCSKRGSSEGPYCGGHCCQALEVGKRSADSTVAPGSLAWLPLW